MSSSAVSEPDLKFMVALLDYALFSCPVDGGITQADGTTTSRAAIEELKNRLKNSGQASESDLQLMNAVLDYSLFACSVDNGVDIGDGVTAERQMIEDLKGRVQKTLDERTSTSAISAQDTGGPSAGVPTAEAKLEPPLPDSDLRTLIAVLDYSLLYIPDGSVNAQDGSTINKETIEVLKRKLEEIRAGSSQNQTN